jgi:hypothetical protein
MAKNACQIWTRRAQRDTFLSIPPSQNSSDFTFTVLSHQYVPTMRTSCSKVTCHVTSRLWGRSTLFGSLESCQLELAYSWGSTPSIKGILSQALLHTYRYFSQEKKEHPHPTTSTTCLHPYHLSLAFWLLFHMFAFLVCC